VSSQAAERIARPTLVPSLDDLARDVREHADLFLRAEADGLRHAIAAGDSLWQARKLVPAQQWTRWIEEKCDLSHVLANRYMRFAYYKDQLPSGATITEARALLCGLPAVGPKGRSAYATPLPIRKEARELRRAGMSISAIAEYCEISWTTAKMLTDPDEEKRRKVANRERLARKRAAFKALSNQENAQLVARSGGSASRAYERIRKAAPELERALKEAAEPSIKQAFLDALGSLHKAEDAIVRAVREGAS
jgi:DNA-binding transcriptional MerR regulator